MHIHRGGGGVERGTNLPADLKEIPKEKKNITRIFKHHPTNLGTGVDYNDFVHAQRLLDVKNLLSNVWN